MGRYKLIIVNASLFCLACGFGDGVAYSAPKPAENPYIARVVQAIYHAEGVNSRHPYGILSVQTSDPRQTCYEVVNWRYLVWSSGPRTESFISYLSRSYCPIGASNDPTGLNVNWVRNVSYFMEAI